MLFSFLIFIIIKTVVFGDPVNGWPSLACILIFVSGVQLFFLGIIGIYLSKKYNLIPDMVDVNRRSIDLAYKNAKLNDVNIIQNGDNDGPFWNGALACCSLKDVLRVAERNNVLISELESCSKKILNK